MNSCGLRLAVLLIVGLVGSTGAIAAEQTAATDIPGKRTDTPEFWGDPEPEDRADQGWTWFGMGYEQRTQATGAAADAAGGGAAGAPGHHSNSRRK